MVDIKRPAQGVRGKQKSEVRGLRNGDGVKRGAGETESNYEFSILNVEFETGDPLERVGTESNRVSEETWNP